MDPTSLFLFAIAAALVLLQVFSGRKRRQQAEIVKSNIVVGARVLTHSGIIGDVTAIADDIVSVKTGNSVIEVKRGAIREAIASPLPAAVKKAAPAAKKPAAKTTAAKTTAAKKPAAKKPAAK